MAGFEGFAPPDSLVIVPSEPGGAGQLSVPTWKRWPAANVATGVVPSDSTVAARWPMAKLAFDIDVLFARANVSPSVLVAVYTRPVEKQPLLPVAPSNTRRMLEPSFTSCGSSSSVFQCENAVPVPRTPP